MNDEARRWEAVRNTVEGAYQAFGRYTLKGPILCEMSDRPIVLNNVPLRQRVVQDFERYQWKAITTLGTIEDYKHFLPRLLDLNSAQHRRRAIVREAMSCEELMGPSIGLDMIAMKLEYAQAKSWPMGERDALQAFGIARWWWELALPENYGGGVRDAMALLDSIGRPICEHLTGTFASFGEEELSALARFVNQTVRFRPEGPYFDWVGNCEGGNPLARWLLAAEVEAALEGAFFQASDAAAGEILSSAVQLLGWVRATHTEGN